MKIETKRLVLFPVNKTIVENLLNNETEALNKLGIKINEEWPRKDTMVVLEILLKTMSDSDEPPGYDLWIIIKKESMTVIGDAGFKGKPCENGVIELGYGIISSERNRGYGSESVIELTKWALSQDEVNSIKADCLIDNLGSISILEKIGMKEISRDDKYIYWELVKH